MNLLLVFAVALELEPTAARLRLAEDGSNDFEWLYRGEVAGHAVTAAATGVGRTLARDLCRRLAEQFGPELILFSGAAGALVPGLAVGDLVCPREVLLWEGTDLDLLDGSALQLPARQVSADAEVARGIQRAAHSVGLRLDRRPLVTVDAVVREPEHKRALGRAAGAQAVDMESAASVACAVELGIPCAVVRAISDVVDDRIPDMLGEAIGPDGRFRPAEISRIAEDPELLAVLRRLGSSFNTAACNLASLFEAYLGS